MKYIALISLLLASFSFNANAGSEFGEKVNCRNTTSQLPIYAGWASCRPHGASFPIQQYVAPTTLSYVYISQYSQGSFKSCWANVPFSHYSSVTNTTCDYKPVSSISATPHEFWETYVRVSGRDYDGNVVKTELWIDGVKKPNRGATSNYAIIHSTVPFTVKVVVTDDDGYTHTSTKTVTPRNVGPIMCGDVPC